MWLMAWIEGHPGTASWMQAVGSILAILAAIWIARRSENANKRSAEIKAQAVCEAVSKISWRCIGSITKLRAESASAKKENREPSNDQVLVTIMLMDSLKGMTPIDFAKPEALVFFYEIRARLEEALSFTMDDLKADYMVHMMGADVIEKSLKKAIFAVNKFDAVRQ